MVGILSEVEQDSNRQPLDDFHVVAGCVLRRQQAEAIAARAGHMLDVATIIPAERIDVNRHRLAAVHAGELRLLEIGRYPDVIRLGYEHQRLSGLDTRAELHRALADNAIGRRVNLRVAEIQ